jgi:hypothetical protein
MELSTYNAWEVFLSAYQQWTETFETSRRTYHRPEPICTENWNLIIRNIPAAPYYHALIRLTSMRDTRLPHTTRLRI